MPTAIPAPHVVLERTAVFSVFSAVLNGSSSGATHTSTGTSTSTSTSTLVPRHLITTPDQLYEALGLDSDLAKETSLAERREISGVRTLRSRQCVVSRSDHITSHHINQITSDYITSRQVRSHHIRSRVMVFQQARPISTPAA